jgi:hypothetical protein
LKNLPIACSLDPADVDHRRCEFQRIAGFTDALELTGSGMRARFEPRPGLLLDVARLIDVERDCCRFLQFRLTVEQDGGPIWLDVSGPPGTDAFLRETLGARAHEHPS